MITKEEFIEWLYNTKRGPYRIVLVELDHSSGTIYLASESWISDTLIEYDGALLSRFVIEDSLDNFLGVGDLDAVNMDEFVNWLSLKFRGYEARWFLGDIEWPKSDFRRIATVTQDGCRYLKENQYRFGLTDNGQSLKRTFVTANTTQSGTLKVVSDYIMTQAGLPAITYINIDTIVNADASVGRNFAVSADFTATSIVSTELKKLAASVGAYIRVAQGGGVEMFIPEIPAIPDITLTEDDISYAGMRITEVTPSYKTVNLEMYDGTIRTDATLADTGDLDEAITINTNLTNVVQADTMLAEFVITYGLSRSIWRLPTHDIASVIEVGGPLKIEHPDLIAVGIVDRIQRTPLSSFSNVEVLV